MMLKGFLCINSFYGSIQTGTANTECSTAFHGATLLVSSVISWQHSLVYKHLFFLNLGSKYAFEPY